MKQITVSNTPATSAFAALLAGLSVNNYNVGDIVDGEIIATTRGGFYVNIRTKSDAFLNADEAGELKVGDKARFVITRKTESDEEFTISHTRVVSADKRNAAWEKLSSACKTEATIQAQVTKVLRARSDDHFAGVEATIDGVTCFVPRRELVFFGNPNKLFGTAIPVKVTSCDRHAEPRASVILSHARAVHEQQREFLSTLQIGSLVKGTVTRILANEKGVLIDLGQTTGLVPRCDLAQSRAVRTADVVEVGEELELEVVRKDVSKGTVSLSRVGALFKTLKYGEVISGVVANVAPFGVFVSIHGSVDGLLHDSELNGADKGDFKVGDKTTVRIKDVNLKQNRISLTRVGVSNES